MTRLSSKLSKSNLDPDKSEWIDMTETNSNDGTERSVSPNVDGDDDLSDTDFPCEQCDFTTTSKSELKSHVRKWHPIVRLAQMAFLPRDEAAAKPTVPRSTVGFKTGGLKQKKLPKRTPPAQSPSSDKLLYECKECDYSSKTAGCLANHEKKHGREDKFRCPLCTFSCGVQGGMQRHLRFCHKTHRPAEQEDDPQSSTIAPPVSRVQFISLKGAH